MIWQHNTANTGIPTPPVLKARENHGLADFCRPRARYPVPPRRAFTLLELLVALLMTSILAASLAGTMRIAFQARSSSEAAVEPSRSAEQAMDMLRVDLESALNPNPNAATNTGIFQQNFEAPGTIDSTNLLEVYTTADSPEHVDANGEIKMVGLALETQAGDQVLVRRVTRNLTAQILPNPDEEVICRGVSAFQLEFFDGTSWQPNWDSTVDLDPNSNPALPMAVRVTLELQRPQPGGQVRTFRFIRVFQLSCSLLVPGDSTSSTSGTGL